ncbi:MAG: hypothetical protein Q9190_007533, partial [Brigantiaea leucoxantha]
MPYLPIPSGKIFYTIHDPASSSPSPQLTTTPTLILHHGLGSSHNYYAAIIPILTSPTYNFRCIAFDTISSGRLSSIAGSGSDKAQGQSVETLAQDVLDLMDALEIGRQEK